MPFNWPFSRFFGAGRRSAATIEAIYGAIVAQARLPVFYRDMAVPDTVEGRFDLIVLHLWLTMRRLRLIEGGAEWSQRLFDHFCSDMDANLREMGVGDLTVPKRMKSFGEAFFGRIATYDEAWEDVSGAALRVALARNILGRPTEPQKAVPLAAYVRKATALIDKSDIVAAGTVIFPAPELGEQNAGQN
jgi:cytochrome b pre-mRNA-processing protein 3